MPTAPADSSGFVPVDVALGSRIDLQQRGHRGAPVPGGRAWRSLTCEGDASTSLKAAVAGSLLLNVQMFAGKARCMSEDAPELAAELVVDGAVPSQPVVSPDGCWVAYVAAPAGRGEERCMCALWVAAADGSSPPWKLTAGTAADSEPRWAPDSGSVFFLSDRTGSRQLHRVRVGGGEAEVLTDWRGEIYDAWPLADARLVAVVATDEPTEEDKRRRAERDDAFVWGQQLPCGRLRVLDLATGELRTVDGLGHRHVVELAARPGGGALAAISWAGPEKDRGVTTSELHVVDLEAGTARDLGRIGTEARSPVWWQADGGWHLAYLAMPEPYGGDAPRASRPEQPTNALAARPAAPRPPRSPPPYTSPCAGRPRSLQPLALAVPVEQQRDHHLRVGRRPPVPISALSATELAQIQGCHRVQHNEDQIVLGRPLAARSSVATAAGAVIPMSPPEGSSPDAPCRYPSAPAAAATAARSRRSVLGHQVTVAVQAWI